jgi:hypothetical protein
MKSYDRKLALIYDNLHSNKDYKFESNFIFNMITDYNSIDVYKNFSYDEVDDYKMMVVCKK